MPCDIWDTEPMLKYPAPTYSINTAAADPARCGAQLGEIISRRPANLRVTSEDLTGILRR